MHSILGVHRWWTPGEESQLWCGELCSRWKTRHRELQEILSIAGLRTCGYWACTAVLKSKSLEQMPHAMRWSAMVQHQCWLVGRDQYMLQFLSSANMGAGLFSSKFQISTEKNISWRCGANKDRKGRVSSSSDTPIVIRAAGALHSVPSGQGEDCFRQGSQKILDL